MNVDEMRLKNTLSHEVHVTQTSRDVTTTTRSQCMLTGCATCACKCSCICWSLCHACPHCSCCCCSGCKYTVFVASFLQQEMHSFHSPSVTVNCVSCYRIDHCNFCIRVVCKRWNRYFQLFSPLSMQLSAWASWVGTAKFHCCSSCGVAINTERLSRCFQQTR